MAGRARGGCRIAVAGVLVALLFGPDGARAQSPTSPGGSWLGALGLKGALTLKNFSHFEETPTDNRNLRNEAILQLEWGRRLAPWGALKLVAEAREDDDSFARGFTFQIPETGERRSILNLKEAVLELGRGPVQLSLGKQMFAWGTADAYNPTDNLNPYDYLDPIANEKLGVYAAAARWSAGPSTLTFALVPVFTPSRTPLLGSRWLPLPTPPPLGLPPALVRRLGIKPIPMLILDSRDVPPPEVENMQYAARLRTTFRGWDFSVSYFDGFEHTPVIKVSPAATGKDTEAFRLTPVFTRMKAPGFDFSTTYGKLEVHGEGAFKLVEANGRDDRFQTIGGVNYTWDELELPWLERIHFVFEYARETILASNSRSSILDEDQLLRLGVALPNRAFGDALIARILLTFTEDTQLTLSRIMDLSQTFNDYVQLKLTHKLTDALRFEAGLDAFTGDPDTFWGRWGANDRLFFSLTYLF